MSDSRLQEIVTKAVVGRAECRMAWSHTVPAEGVTGVLGVHVTDAAVGVKEQDGAAEVELSAEIDLWCGGSRSTKVIRCTARKSEAVNIRPVSPVLGDAAVHAQLLGHVQATGVSVGEAGITLDLTADVSLEMSAVTRLWVKSYQLDEAALDDLEDPESDSGSDSGSGE